MILDTIFRLLTAPLRVLLQAMPTIGIEIPSDVFVQITEYIKLACYFLPVKTIVAVLTLKFAMWAFRITMAFIVRVKSFIPTMGS